MTNDLLVGIACGLGLAAIVAGAVALAIAVTPKPRRTPPPPRPPAVPPTPARRPEPVTAIIPIFNLRDLRVGPDATRTMPAVPSSAPQPRPWRHRTTTTYGGRSR